MIWLFERDPQAMRVETRFDKASKTYVIEITRADLSAETERYEGWAAFNARILALEAELDAENWTLAGSPTIVVDGWKP